jgi:hypothetical protein
MAAMGRRTGVVLVSAAVLALVASCTATAATRYAAPGGTGEDPCANPARPCSVFTAADENARGTTVKAGDVVELAPGTYYVKSEGDFGYENAITPPAGVTVRGKPGKERPVVAIPVRGSYAGAFSLGPGAELADVEIRNRSGRGSTIEVWGGTLERVIVRVADIEPACNFSAGTIRSSACFNSGGGPALGVNMAAKGTFDGVIRNSTLIATGPGSVGMDFILHAFKRGMTVNIDAAGVLIKGEEKDVAAYAGALNKGRGADVDIELRSSGYATVETDAKQGGTASITRPGTNGNITALPVLGAGNLHQLPGSPTVDRGTVDAASGLLDIDGQPWAAGVLPDIGADELTGRAPRVNPSPDTLLVGHPRKRDWRRKAELTFGSSEVGSRYECRIDGKPFRSCASPFVAKIGLGRHRFEVRAVDPQGKADRSPAVFGWRVLPLRAFLS